MEAITVAIASFCVSGLTGGWTIFSGVRKALDDRALLRVRAEVTRDKYTIHTTFILTNRGRRPLTIRSFYAIDESGVRHTIDDQLLVDLPITLEESKFHETTMSDDALDRHPTIVGFEVVDSEGRQWPMRPVDQLQWHRDVVRARNERRKEIDGANRRAAVEFAQRVLEASGEKRES